MPTITPVILPAKALKGNKHKIRIAIAHNGQTRYINTDIIINSISEFRNGQIAKRPDAAMLNVKLRKELTKYQSMIDELPYIDGLTCPELICQIKTHEDKVNISLTALFEEYMKLSTCATSTFNLYQTLWKVISGIIDTTMVASSVTYSVSMRLLVGLMKKCTPATTRNVLSLFSSVLKFGTRAGLVRFQVDPMLGIKAPGAFPRDSWLSPTEIRTIRDVELPKGIISISRDLFMLSYYLGGMNLVDIVNYDFAKHPKLLKYERTKTKRLVKVNRYVEFEMPEEVPPLVKKIGRECGFSRFTYRNYIANSMQKIREITGIEKLVFYSARKSFSQHAFNLGVQTGVIDYILGHSLGGGRSCLYSYISVTPEMATKAVRLVLDNLKTS